MTQKTKEQRPTIKEVAKAAGVSFKTVARVANNEAAVSKETRAAVRKAMKSLNYTPNVSARQLRSNRSYLICLADSVPISAGTASAAAMYLARAQPGATRRCNELGYNIIMTEVTPENEGRVVVRLKQLNIDGVIVLPPLSLRDSFVAELREKKIRHVLISSDKGGGFAPTVAIDDKRGAYEMTNYLIKLGHRKIGFVTGSSLHASLLRHAGFIDALRDAGIERRLDLEMAGDFTFRSGEEGGQRLLDNPDPPTAIFASNDEMALGVMLAAARAGIKVPDQLSIVGYDDAPSATVVWPQLTTVRQPLPEMTAKAVDLLVNEAMYREAGTIMLDFTIIERGSSSAPGRG